MTLAEYVEWRNGRPLGSRGSLREMLDRSLGAATFSGFWRYWNPIWGYYLGRFVNTPLRRVVPAGPAVIATFVVSGAIHDAAVTAVTGSPTLLFVPWFLVLGLIVVGTSRAGVDLGSRPWAVRATVNLSLVGMALGLAVVSKWVIDLT